MREYLKLLLCVSYWETRKMRGPLAVFYIWHNMGCEMRANMYRAKIRHLAAKQGILPCKK